MPAPATMQTDTGIDLSFLAASTPNGYIPTAPMAVLKDIQVPGVDYNRHRHEHFQFPEFDWTTLAEVANYDLAIGMGVYYDGLVGHLVTIRITLAGYDYTLPNLLVLQSETRPIAIRGRCLGANTDPAYTSGVKHRWRMQATELILP